MPDIVYSLPSEKPYCVPVECCCCVWSVLLLSWIIRLWGGTPLAWLAACVVSWDTRVMIVVRGHSYMYIAAAAARSEK